VEKYNTEITKLDKLELVQVSVDKDGKEIARAHDSGTVMKKFKEVSK
jgi:hypothetical protein